MEKILLSELEADLWGLLEKYPQGISEFELLRLLQQQDANDFGADMLRDDLSMFRAHFLLFHALYRLADYLFEQKLALLDIHVLKIRLLPWQQIASNELSLNDPLRAYYLDLGNLQETSLQDVEDLLGQFWLRYFANEQRPQALQTLGLDQRADSAEIEQRYRQLAMLHHPDRGGDQQKFQQLQQAIMLLRRCQ